MDQSRAGLDFPAAVRNAFAFVKDLGFREVGADATIVRYATEWVLLTIYHGRSSYELGVEVALVNAERREPGYTLNEFFRLASAEDATHEELKSYCATTAAEVAIGVGKLASLAKVYLPTALRGDEGIFEALARQRQAWATGFAADVAYRQLSPKAAAAFREGKYREAAELYESIRNRLSSAELAKLEYAKQHQ
jgi:hypothetical protein